MALVLVLGSVVRREVWAVKLLGKRINTVYITEVIIIFIYPRLTWLFIKKVFIIQVLKFLMTFHKILKMFLTILRDLKEF
jgi:hypothetical protein